MSMRLYLLAGIVLCLIAAGGALYLAGRSDEARTTENKNLRATERQRDERDDIDAEVRDLDHPGLCRLLDGVWQDGICR